MKNFFIIANNSKESTEKFRDEIKAYIESKGGKCIPSTGNGRRKDGGYTDISEVPKDTDGVIVLGGDGTLLQASQDLRELNLPIVGINVGTLGFLAAVEPSEAFTAIDRLMGEEYVVEERMLLNGNIKAKPEESRKASALNEIVLIGERPMQVVDLSVYINGQLLHRYFGDGVIVSTPTGSTGYNLSAGGPIVNPTAKTMILTPVSPHSMHNRSIVFSEDDIVRIVVNEGRDGQEQQVVAAFDGSHRISLHTGDEIEISKSSKITKIVKINEESFLATLQDKLKD